MEKEWNKPEEFFIHNQNKVKFNTYKNETLTTFEITYVDASIAYQTYTFIYIPYSF